MTGGLKEQVTDGENWFGVGIEPASQVIVGSQQVPFIYEDRLNKQDFIDALLKMYNMSREERRKVGLAGQAHAHKNYNYEEFKILHYCLSIIFGGIQHQSAIVHDLNPFP